MPHMERWLNRDPIGLDGGLNIYGYVEQNPVMYIDPKGLDTMCPNGNWIPDPDNHGHGEYRDTRDQGPQCSSGNCAESPPSHNDACLQACINREWSTCMTGNLGAAALCTGIVLASCSSQTCDKCDDE